MTMRVEGTVSTLRCAGLGHQTPHLTFSSDTDMVTLGLGSLSSVAANEIVVAEQTTSEMNDKSSQEFEQRINAFLGRTDLRSLQVRRIVDAPPHAGASFQEFRRSYRTPVLVFACPHCEMDAVAISSMAPSTYRQHGGRLIIVPDVEDGLIAIPKASSVAHVRENRAAADIVLSDAQLATLDAAFPRPAGRRPLEML